MVCMHLLIKNKQTSKQAIKQTQNWFENYSSLTKTHCPSGVFKEPAVKKKINH